MYLERGQIRAAQDSLARLNEATGEIQTDTRELIGSLLSVKLPGVDFCNSLRQVVAGFEHSTGLPVRLEMDQLPPQRLQERLQAHC